MKKFLSRRSLSIVLALIMVLAIAAPALAASSKIVTSNATVYSGPGQSYPKLGTVSRNTVLTSTGIDGPWTIIDYSGKTGYVLTSRVKDYSGTGTGSSSGSSGSGTNTGENPTYANRETVYATGTVNVRKGPGTSYSKLGQLAKGDAVSKLGTVDGWTLIDWSDGIAYVSSQYLTSSGSGSSGGSSTNVMQATANVNVRSGPGTKYTIVGWLAKGDTITKTGTSGSWTKVTYNGNTAYVSSSYLKAYTGSGGGSSSGDTLLAARIATAVRTGPSTANRAIAYLDPGNTVVYLGTSGAWYKVQIGGSIGYAYGPDMRVIGSTDPMQNSSGVVYATSSIRVYSGSDTSSSTLGYLYEAESAARTGTSGVWTRINYKGATGYVYTSQVIAVTGTGANTMNAIGAYMRTNTAGAPAYIVPIASSSYVKGYLETTDLIYAIAGNSYWTKISVSGMTLFTETKYLNYSSGGTTTGKSFMIATSNTYSDLGTTAFMVGSRLVPIASGTYVTILYYNLGGYTKIRWYDSISGTCDAWVLTSNIYYVP